MKFNGLLLAQSRNDIVILPWFEALRFRSDRIAARLQLWEVEAACVIGFGGTP